MHFETLLLETHGRVGLITLNRPAVLNALSSQTIAEINLALDELEHNPAIGCMVITGSSKAFAAGADIKEMADFAAPQVFLDDFFSAADRIAARRKPLIAAVAGYALGGGCEVALMCDFIYAAENARFGLPEITLGVIPGIGGTQRLSRAVGKAKAMEMCMTGRQMNAAEAEQTGLVARTFPVETLLEETLKTANKIAELSLPAVMMLKESLNRAFESSLSEGVRFERRMFHSTFANQDQKEGMRAFVEKRPARFKHC
ncbi:MULTISPECIES: enoyl-CoA hydratase [Pseudomonas]|uniref:enoyl-CoA hydratase n=1 Tax=Pseudomonas monteilii TaxID=76759 RepID=A0AAE6RDS0_9PSED|nr:MULTISPECIES: enoyl-CoA hydratase [Pseudomonas]MDH4549912.1 enoyl-CoA hydratase [Pseudomonas sp. BN607]MDH4846110.1 enoyl-CoA hydratase [Pseudomonas sp. BN605]MDH4858782.1 enoyl-CoA hydratase [Pseudomonas sp. BN505]NWL08061.1 enoyl-CoA hydratase [Pseudomonas hunanensis]QHB28824.1 enoyl-CoA hydratase [Pseudomonas monteilii]